MPGYDLHDTIVAPATAPVASAIGMLRLSGARAWAIAASLVHGLPEAPEARHAYVGALELRLPDATLLRDRCVATLWRAPHSYTGEDMAELSVHGNPLLLRQLAAVCSAATAVGAPAARPAEAGEFTYRANLNGKLDLAQAEAVQELIQAGSLKALALAASGLAGTQSACVRGWVERLTTLLAGIEVIHDYAADDLDATLDQATLLTAGKLQAALSELRAELTAALDASRRSAPLRSGISIAICGPPNVGKSTLFNALLGAERALTAPQPGTTRDYLTESLDAAGLRLTLVDTAGYRDTADALEAAGVRRSGDWARSADQVLWVSAADDPAGAALPAELAHLQPVQVVTKCDLIPLGAGDTPASSFVGAAVRLPSLNGAQRQAATPGEGSLTAPSTSGTSPIQVSGRTGAGVPELLQRLSEFAGALGEPALDSFNARQSAQIEQAAGSLDSALVALAGGLPMDAVALDLYAARESLHGIYEQVDHDGVIAAIFSGFCVGK